MSGCTESDKPLISILMAVYEPRMDWLREQLQSLNRQTYPNLMLYVRDDCSPTVPYEEICACIEACISAFPFTVERNKENLGSNETFELLTREAEGDYFAYCDQDDVWETEKLEKLAAALERENAGLACSDLYVIDGAGRRIADSIRELRPRHALHAGTGFAGELIFRNFVTGCAMLVRGGVAKASLPFAKSMVHDHYLAFFCAMEHRISVCPETLVGYRQHGGNQTGVLSGVTDKKSYVEWHLGAYCRRVEELHARFNLPELEEAVSWADARQKNAAHRRRGMRALWHLRRLNPSTALFELVALRLPEPLFRLALRLIRLGKI